jgi:hypothetical protein
MVRLLRWAAVGVLALAVVGVAPAVAQQSVGRIDVTIMDSTGGVLPGVTVNITGPLNQMMVTDERGEAHFLNLTVGTYQVTANLQGFNEYRNTNVPVAAGVAVPLKIQLAVAGAQETINVTAETPVIDTKKETTATTVSLAELQDVPTARDPWVVMQSVPGIITDRVNVGGSESGQQSGFMGKGTDSGQTTWNVDGMPITDMSSLSSPFYYDFDMFSEMSVTTGGADVKSSTGGIQLNFMLKSGTNNFHGNARTYYESEGMQGTNLPSSLNYLAGKTGKGDRTDMYLDAGGDIGGPVIKDKWWFWGAYGKTDVRILKLAGAKDRTLLKNVSFKTQAQVLNPLRVSFTYFNANKLKWGRGAGSTRPQETTYDQTGPNDLYKGEANYVLGSNLFIVGRFAHVKGGFAFQPEGGFDNVQVWRDASNVWHGSYNNYVTDRPQDTFNMDANYFRGNQEFKFGYSWRKTEVHSTSEWPNNYYTYFNYSAGEAPIMTVNVAAPWGSDGASKYQSFYAGDTITMDRATINLGVRFDHQTASVLPTSGVAASAPGAAAYLPAVTAPGVANAIKQNVIQPRVGITYALDESRKTQLRATYSMFTDQIGSGTASFLSVAQYRWYYVDVTDLNGNHIADPNEFPTDPAIYAADINNGDYGGFDPSNPAGSTTTSFHSVGDYGAPRTHELIVGVDRELMPNFGLSASFTYRRMNNFNWRPLKNITTNDFVQVDSISGSLPSGIPGTSGGSYDTPIYGLSDASLIPAGKGRVYETHKDYYQKFVGFEMSATKRMSNHWMARFGFSTNNWKEYGSNGQPTAYTWDPTRTLSNPNISGGDVAVASGGSGKSGIYMVLPTYQFSANGVYQAPYGINFGANYLIRQGYAMPWYSTVRGISDPLGSTKSVLLVGQFAQDRLPAVQTMDIRVGKQFTFRTVRLNVDFDVFNLFNSATVLGRQYNAYVTSGTPQYTDVMEIMQPRIARIGVRIGF